MPKSLDLFLLLLVAVAGWMNQEKQVSECLGAENRILRAQMGTRRLRFDDDQRRGLPIRGKVLNLGSKFSLSFTNVGSLCCSPESD